jgi:hypothetical protein
MKRMMAVVLLLGGAAFAEGKGAAAGGTKVDVKGHYYETCGCKVSCPCATGMFKPSETHCDAVSFLHIDKGMVGKTKMDGLNVAVVFRSPADTIVLDAFNKHESDHFAVYLDDKASDEQKKAFPMMLGALFGTDEMKGAKPPAFAPITLTADEENAKMVVGDKMTAEIVNIKIGETKMGGKSVAKHIMLEGAVPFPWMGKETQGKSVSFHYADGPIKWDYKDRNAYFGDFKYAGMFSPPAAPAAK